MSVTSAEWLRLIEQEYLSSFITSGGSAVKFAVMPDPGAADLVSEQLDSLAEQHGLVRAALDSAATRLHMIQDVFFGLFAGTGASGGLYCLRGVDQQGNAAVRSRQALYVGNAQRGRSEAERRRDDRGPVSVAAKHRPL